MVFSVTERCYPLPAISAVNCVERGVAAEGDALQVEVPVALPSASQFQEGIVRRKLLVELSVLDAMLLEFDHKDTISDSLREISARFQFYLHGVASATVVRDKFIRLVQLTLIDPLRLAPLDDFTVLGSDDRVYGGMTLALDLRHRCEKDRFRSPFALRGEYSSLFTASAHFPARHMVGWLRRYDALIVADAIESEYEDLERINELPSIPTLDSYIEHKNRQNIRDRIALIRAQQLALQLEGEVEDRPQLEAFCACLEGGEVAVLEIARVGREALREVSNARNQQEDEVVATLRERDRLGLCPLEEADQIFKERMASLKARLKIERAGIDQASGQIEDCERVHRELECEITKFEKNLMKRNRRWIAELIKTGEIIAIYTCAL